MHNFSKINLKGEPGMNNYDKRLLFATLIVILTFGFLYGVVFFVEITPEKKDIITFIVGFLLGTGLASIITFFFGSSDKKGKDEIPKEPTS